MECRARKGSNETAAQQLRWTAAPKQTPGPEWTETVDGCQQLLERGMSPVFWRNRERALRTFDFWLRVVGR